METRKTEKIELFQNHILITRSQYAREYGSKKITMYKFPEDLYEKGFCPELADLIKDKVKTTAKDAEDSITTLTTDVMLQLFAQDYVEAPRNIIFLIDAEQSELLINKVLKELLPLLKQADKMISSLPKDIPSPITFSEINNQIKIILDKVFLENKLVNEKVNRVKLF